MSSDPTSRGPGDPDEPTTLQEGFSAGSRVGEDSLPGEVSDEIAGDTVAAELRTYLMGLGFSILLTAAAFLCVGTHLIYGPGIVMAVVVFGLAQVGIHLVFFLHMTSSPDNTNNMLALAFGFLIISLIVFGSIWIMYEMNHNMMPMPGHGTMQ